MARFNFEKNLKHQTRAVYSVVRVFDGVELVQPQGIEKHYSNPVFNITGNTQFFKNIKLIQEENHLEKKVDQSNHIIDIMMETGTGKTYTYTKTIFELNKLYGIFKFIIVVPTLAIKAGTINFLQSDSAREHFKEQYNKTLNLHIVESKKANKNKNKKSYLPPAVNRFVNAGVYEKDKIQVLIINAGMINSDTMQKSFDKNLFDKYSVPFEAISATKAFMIIDEPHKFPTKKASKKKSKKNETTWDKIQKLQPQFIIRYGATFPEKEIKQRNVLGKIEKIRKKDYHNLLYSLTAVDAFNQNLVKGVIGHITEFDEGQNVLVRFVNSNGHEATFELIENNNKKKFKIAKKESLEKIHSAMTDLFVEKLNKKELILSNGLTLRIGNEINPYSYAETLQEQMIKKSIANHFELEKKYLKQEVKIKPLTLFFIDNIQEYRNKDGYIRKTVEKYVKAEVNKLLETEENEFYKQYLEKTKQDISRTHGGYFSKDNSEKDEAIEKEINEILHNKEAILDLNNPRRFIFSKWTLREGWDNPNVFQICKLRSSGSEISKLQEVGRGLRLPVNQFGNRVKNEDFYLHYFVDFTENDFVEKLVNEINKKSNAISREIISEKISEQMIKQIIEKYNISEEALLKELDEKGIIKRTNEFKEKGFEYIKEHYPLIFEGIDSNKVRKAGKIKKKIKIRVEKYPVLKDLWEKINEKVILEYKIENEEKFKGLFIDFLKNTSLIIEGVQERKQRIDIENNQAIVNEEFGIYKNELTYISTIKYKDFLKALSKTLYINLNTLHQSFVDLQININQFLNQSTITLMKQKFDNYLLHKAITKFGIEYQKVTNTVHPTKLTDKNGDVKKEINASDVGTLFSNESVAKNYFFEELFYDSELEKENIVKNIQEVDVFTKI